MMVGIFRNRWPELSEDNHRDFVFELINVKSTHLSMLLSKPFLQAWRIEIKSLISKILVSGRFKFTLT